MNNKLVIFGAGDIAELACYYFSRDSDYEVVGFVVDREFLKVETFCDLPVSAFEDITKNFPLDQHSIFIALSYAKLNALRRDKYFAAKSLGYSFASYVSSRATILNENAIGENCFILEDNTIQPFVRIGNNTTLWSGNHIGHHSVIQDHTFISSHVVVSGGVEIGEQCFIGVNATLRDHIKIGKRCVIGAGAVILDDAPDDGVYITSKTERSKVPSGRLRKI